ncbi:MAG TPA: ABC transporter ATP-binding protein [Terriglobales bacterium]|nr:ABC transporter ATP-binding protein [Terriglobales bacterium]
MRVEVLERASKQVEAGLRAEGLARRFPSGTGMLVVFEDLDLQVNPGEMVAIVGESGTGKSSLLHLLSGLDRPSGGDVYFGTRSLARMGEETLAEFRNREIGFVWQQSYLLPEFTAQENVMLPLLIAGQTQANAATAAAAWLERVDLGARAGHRSGELSGGEQQRVAMARALVNRPRFLMADEPTGNLDERAGAALFSLLRRLHEEEHLTSIIVTHNQAQAASCDRILRLRQGQLHTEVPGGGAPRRE